MHLMLLSPSDRQTVRPSPSDRHRQTVTSDRHLRPSRQTVASDRRVTSPQVTSRHVTSRRVASRHVTSGQVTSGHVTSRHRQSVAVTVGPSPPDRHVTSRHVTSRHVKRPSGAPCSHCPYLIIFKISSCNYYHNFTT